MKSVLLVVMLMSTAAYAGGSSCSEEPAKGSECEIVRTYTRCDLEKQKLRHRINELEKELKEANSKRVVERHMERVVVREVEVEKQVIKHNILSLYTTKDVSSFSATQTGNTATATVQAQYEPGIKYQYQFNFGLVPEVGINIKGNPELGLGFEF